MVGIPKLTIRDVPIDNKTVLLRADFNVPLNKKGEISDDYRISSTAPTIENLLSRGCKVVIISHLGRPKGRDKKFSLKPIAVRLSQLLGSDVKFVSDCIGDKVVQAVKKSPNGSVLLLENLRFYPQEEANDDSFAKNIALVSGARYFVQDGFGVVHRAHASTSAITKYLPSVAGLLLEKEYSSLTSSIENPKKPLVAVIGGAKVSDKIAIIKRFIKFADRIIIGGAMANTFLSFRGYYMGSSVVEPNQNKVIEEIYRMVRRKVSQDYVDDFLVLPVDVAVASKIDSNETRRTIAVNKLSKDDIALDIGEKSIENMVHIITKAKTVIWNGTLGYAELPEFSHGSARLALEIAKNPSLISIIGGGDTADYVLKWDGNNGKAFSHISTGGGASIELLSGIKLPGIESLLDKKRHNAIN